jgi:hypothetical protein
MSKPNKMGMTDKQIMRRRNANRAADEARKTPEQKAAEHARMMEKPIMQIMAAVGRGEMTVDEGVAAAEAINKKGEN